MPLMYRLIIYNQRFGKFDLVRIVPFPNANPPSAVIRTGWSFGTAMAAAGARVPSCLPGSLPAEVLELYCVAMPREETAACTVQGRLRAPPIFKSRWHCTTRSRMRPPALSRKPRDILPGGTKTLGFSFVESLLSRCAHAYICGPALVCLQTVVTQVACIQKQAGLSGGNRTSRGC